MKKLARRLLSFFSGLRQRGNNYPFFITAVNSSPARITISILAAFLIFLGSVYSASSTKTTNRQSALDREPKNMPASMPGVFMNFNPRYIPELQQTQITPDVEPETAKLIPQPSQKDSYGPHRVAFYPASVAKPAAYGTSIPLEDRMPTGYTDLNEKEDDLVYSSNLYTDTTIYANWVTKAKALSSKNKEGFYEQNLRYDLYTTKCNGDSLSLIVDTTHTNNNSEYKEGFALNQLSLESRTPKSSLVFGHSYPEFSEFTITQQVMGFYGAQKLSNTELKGFTGFKAAEKDDLKNPRRVGGFRVEHKHDEAVVIGLNAVSTNDVHENPGSDQDLPTIKNRVYSMDVSIKPTDNIYVSGEYAGSDTDFDRRHGAGNQKDTAYRAKAEYGRENFKASGGVESAGTAFLTPLGESLRDQRAFFGNFFYELNRYISTRIGTRTSRDNLASYKTATLVRNTPQVQVTMKPSEYYRDLRMDFFYQPLHEYSDNGKYVDRYRDLLWTEFNHKAGAFRYFAGFSSTIDKDKITTSNDHNINKFDLKLTWDYDMANNIYGLFSNEQYCYVTTGGQDTTLIYGLGGQSQFHEDVTLNLDYTHETDNLTATVSDSTHDRVNFSFTKEYNNLSRMILSFEGSDNKFVATGKNFADFSAKLRFLKSF